MNFEPKGGGSLDLWALYLPRFAVRAQEEAKNRTPIETRHPSLPWWNSKGGGSLDLSSQEGGDSLDLWEGVL